MLGDHQDKKDIDKLEYRNNDATESIKQMEEKFVLDLEYMIEKTKADKETADIIQAVLKKEFDDIPIVCMRRKRIREQGSEYSCTKTES